MSSDAGGKGQELRILHLIDSLLEHNPKFRRMLKSRLKEKTVSVKEARKRI